jgi:glycosyltransferase involved in cell wall biosynthesis
MKIIKEPSFFDQEDADFVRQLEKENRLKLISQGFSLNPLAKELYGLSDNVKIDYIPNPIDIDFDFDLKKQVKKNNIIFLGRLESQKRAWLFCETAKRMPEYEFYVMGKFFRLREQNEEALKPYMNGSVKNLRFVGHLDGEEKHRMIREAKILLNTSIWEGIPISWLEALEKGTLIVSNLNNEELPSKFGAFTGDNFGDGFEGVDSYCKAIKKLMEDDELRNRMAGDAVKYIRERHSRERFRKDIIGKFGECGG